MLTLLLELATAGALAISPVDSVPAEIASLLARATRLADVRTELTRLYEEHGGQSLWLVENRPTPSALAMLARLDSASAWGLRRASFDVDQLDSLSRAAPLSQVEAARFDVALSAATTRFLRALRWGQVRPEQAHAHFLVARGEYDLPAAVAAVVRRASPDSIIDAAEPQFLHYRLLKEHLAKLRQAPADTATPARIRKIELTLERFRWLPREFSAPPIIVNIPAFRLYAFSDESDREENLLMMNVVVGRAYRHQTPVFAADMTYLVFSPSWDVPQSIARSETRPAALRNPGYLARNRMELIRDGKVVPATPENITAIGTSVRVRQKPGPGNALGRVKFMLPNDHAVYLHDTPSGDLFEKDRRDFSHGCIRVADPAALASFLLRHDTTWTKQRIEAAMGKGTSTTVRLAKAVPVFIVYGTAMATERGGVLFYDDIYRLDRGLEKLLGLPAAGGRHN